MIKEQPLHPSVFLSHSNKDKSFVRKLANDLGNNGVKVWSDEAEINVGDSLIQKISEGIHSMDYLGVVLYPNSVRSRWVQKEVEIAMNEEIEGRRVKVLPILLEDCDIPSFLKGKFYADFRSISKYNDSLNLLLRTLGIIPRELEEDIYLTLESLRSFLIEKYPDRGPYEDWSDTAELLRELDFIGIKYSTQLENLLERAKPGLLKYMKSIWIKLFDISGTGIVRTAMWMVDEKASTWSIAARQTYRKYHKYISQ